MNASGHRLTSPRLAPPSGLVAIQHHNQLSKVGMEQLRLPARYAHSHQSHHVAIAGLMHFEAVEESFYYDSHAPLPGRGLSRTMEIKNHLRFAESRRKQITRLAAIHRAARVRHQFAAFIVNWKNHASLQESRSAIVAGSEPGRGLPLDPSLFQV